VSLPHGFCRVAATAATQDPPQGITRIEMRFADLLPAAWLQVDPKPKIWFTAFRMVNVSEPAALANAVLFDIVGLRAVLLYGRIPYYDTSGFKLELREEPVAHVQGSGEMRDSPEGAWLVLFGQYDTANIDSESDLKTRISIAKGILATVLGRNVAYEQLCENIHNLEDGTYSGFSNVFANPYVFPALNLRTEAFDKVTRIHETIEQRGDAERNRLRLSLHWFEMGAQEEGVDAFLRRWIAIEILAGCRKGELKPIKRLMGRAYSLPPEKASDAFYIGWLGTIRANIVHHGRIRSMHYVVPLYLEEIYKDCLMAALDVPPAHSALACKNRADHDVAALLRALL
jgi:hypothetical protein